MNLTLQGFGYPQSLVKEYVHWVVMIRPAQVTLGCAVIAARSEATSLGDLAPCEAAELPQVIRDYERAIRGFAPASKFNYLALMMVDPNPHFHAIPRYAAAVRLGATEFTDAGYPKPPDLGHRHELDAAALEWVRLELARHWPRASTEVT
jgi:diadenosine tetraphosphate (Ap4A) HIT family hydrolase